jgi:hypothetical protein
MASSTTNSCASANQNVLQQQHVDWKISNDLLKQGTRDAYKTWNQQDRAGCRDEHVELADDENIREPDAL